MKLVGTSKCGYVINNSNYNNSNKLQKNSWIQINQWEFFITCLNLHNSILACNIFYCCFCISILRILWNLKWLVYAEDTQVRVHSKFKFQVEHSKEITTTLATADQLCTIFIFLTSHQNHQQNWQKFTFKISLSKKVVLLKVR